MVSSSLPFTFVNTSDTLKNEPNRVFCILTIRYHSQMQLRRKGTLFERYMQILFNI